ncbi:type IV toxin-antitoxin system AbiEi family antitoxin domain-containing protein [Patulibacter minatonensis]|uniref:type IV toxin-antitoxin system AbiEi family antitoxin domain-containing protein n=1 Tax=Patulibacter minatonensis TaxID=298163 RepID=UPI00047B8039|nr:type IV toxin-antitoxin system AbiEi family antitoxin domain-containing protein [Patulibacter minatonensis]
MDDARLARLAARQGGVFTSAQMNACGLSPSGARHRVRTSRVFRVRRAAYTLSPHHDALTDLWAVILTIDPGRGCLSHWTAAWMHRMWRATGSPIHMSVVGSGGRRLPGVVVHAPRILLPDDVVEVRGLPVTSAGRTVLDVAARAGDDTVRRLIREGEVQGLLPAGEMLRVVAAHPNHPGAGRVRRVDPGTPADALGQTTLEDELDALIRELPMPAPERQLTVRGASGAWYHLDFGWGTARLAAEADGRSVHERASALESDRFRDNDLAAVGWLTMRFTDRQLRRGRADAGRQLVAAMADRGTSA